MNSQPQQETRADKAAARHLLGFQATKRVSQPSNRMRDAAASQEEKSKEMSKKNLSGHLSSEASSDDDSEFGVEIPIVPPPPPPPPRRVPKQALPTDAAIAILNNNDLTAEEKRWWLSEINAEKERTRKHELAVLTAQAASKTSLLEDTKNRKVDVLEAETREKAKHEAEKRKTAKASAQSKEDAKVRAKQASKAQENAHIRNQLETLRGAKSMVTPGQGGLTSEWKPQLSNGPSSMLPMQMNGLLQYFNIKVSSFIL